MWIVTISDAENKIGKSNISIGFHYGRTKLFRPRSPSPVRPPGALEQAAGPIIFYKKARSGRIAAAPADMGIKDIEIAAPAPRRARRSPLFQY